MSVCEFEFIGNLTRDPNLRIAGNNKTVATIDIAVNKKKGTEYFRVTAWEVIAENAGKYLSTGDLIQVSGEISTNKRQDEAGNTVYGFDFTAKSIEYLVTKKKN